MDALSDLVGRTNEFVWGPYMLAAILGTGIFLMAGLRGIPLRKIGDGFRLL